MYELINIWEYQSIGGGDTKVSVLFIDRSKEALLEELNDIKEKAEKEEDVDSVTLDGDKLVVNYKVYGMTYFCQDTYEIIKGAD